LVKKAKVIPLECVVRGYLSGSGWEEYKQKESICGIRLPPDMEESDKLLEPIFTPATKAKSGHDLNITQKEAADLVGEKLFAELKEKSLKIYQEASNYAEERGLIIADTKFEFGIYKGKVILVDEVLTPDSSRFWAGDEYSPGGPQRSFDKQFVRDYLRSLNWNEEPPAPALPERIVEKTREKYLEATRRIMGKACARESGERR
ncbi:MAG: phosphoribosylaminoimidazolesuccinocarboxamide synthase, partial [Armatimonadetes bacterium CG07_land_8_20_14_0_80_40_9]